MMASRPFASSHAQRLIDVAVPALAGLAILFLAFAAPAGLIERAVTASGLPGVLAAAAPPLGAKARIVLGLGGGAIAFGVVFALLRGLDRLTARPPRAVPVLAPEPPAPRLRRRDLHPDAPPRPPVSATRDLGEPAPPEAPAGTVAPAPETGFEIEAEAEAEIEAGPPAPVSRQESLTDLMARLEQGLTRRVRARRPSPAGAPRVFPDPSDDRLASAIENLQRLAAARRG
jgi:hypothetical protein